MIEQAALYICSVCTVVAAVCCAAAKNAQSSARALALFLGACAMLCALSGCQEAAAVLLFSGAACAGALSWSAAMKDHESPDGGKWTAALFAALAIAGFAVIFYKGLAADGHAAAPADAGPAAASCMSGAYAPVLILLAALIFSAASAAAFMLFPEGKR